MFLLFKILLFLFRPLIWVLVLFAIATFTKNEKRRKRFLTAGFLVLLFFTNPFLIRKCIELYETMPVQLSSSTKYNTGILLGGMVSYNRKDGNGYFNPAADRFIQTAILYKKGQINSIIVAAGNGYITKNKFSEALFVKERLTTLGIPPEKIYTDTSSRNTLENAVYTKKIIDSFKIPGPHLLISSAMHLPRAKLVFGKVGITADLYSCDFVSKRVSNNFLEDYLLPSAYALSNWDNFIKEIAGSIVYKITSKG